MSSDQVGGGFKAAGALYQGQMESASLDQQASMQRDNARVAREKGLADAYRHGIVATHRLGGIKAGYAASGVGANSGSALAVLAMSTANAERDRLNIIHGSELRAVNFENQAILDEYGAKSALQASYYNALTAVAGVGAGSFGKTPGKTKVDADTGETESKDEGDTVDSTGDEVGAEGDFSGGGSGGSGGTDWNYGASEGGAAAVAF